MAFSYFLRKRLYNVGMKNHILSLDLGKGSLGLAVSRSGMFVTILPEIRFHGGCYDEPLPKLKEVIEIETIKEMVIGYPTFPSGDPCEMTPIVEKFIERLKKEFPSIEVTKVDERYSTVEAAEILHQNNINSKKQRDYIDSAAAAVILERYLREIGQM